MKPEPKQFTKENPVRKTDIWRCFRRPGGFSMAQVDIAHSVIGKNAPRYMEQKGYLERLNRANGDYYVLTESGQQWLTKGIAAHLRNHPADAALVRYLPGESTDRRTRRVRRPIAGTPQTGTDF